MIVKIFLILLGFFFLIKGADFLVEGSSNIAKKFYIPEIIIGLTIVSIGTSMPELFVSVSSAINGYEDLAIGNVVGSNLCNLLLILGLSATIRPINFKKETKLIEIPMCLIFTVLFFILGNINQDISNLDGSILSIAFLGFLTYTVLISKKELIKSDKSDICISNISVIRNIFLIVIGIIGLKVGGDFVVESSEFIAKQLHISEKIIGLTIVAIGTSLPELATSVTAAIKGNCDIAIGNIIGSNIFNILFIIGVTSLINPITYNITYNSQMIILFISTVLLAIFPYVGVKNKMTRLNGILYLLLYFAYMIILCI